MAGIYCCRHVVIDYNTKMSFRDRFRTDARGVTPKLLIGIRSKQVINALGGVVDKLNGANKITIIDKPIDFDTDDLTEEHKNTYDDQINRLSRGVTYDRSLKVITINPATIVKEIFEGRSADEVADVWQPVADGASRINWLQNCLRKFEGLRSAERSSEAIQVYDGDIKKTKHELHIALLELEKFRCEAAKSLAESRSDRILGFKDSNGEPYFTPDDTQVPGIPRQYPLYPC